MANEQVKPAPGMRLRHAASLLCVQSPTEFGSGTVSSAAPTSWKSPSRHLSLHSSPPCKCKLLTLLPLVIVCKEIILFLTALSSPPLQSRAKLPNGGRAGSFAYILHRGQCQHKAVENQPSPSKVQNLPRGHLAVARVAKDPSVTLCSKNPPPWAKS